MYKNFSLDNQERKEIMEMHKSHGYRKPISELRGDMFYGEDGDMPEAKPDDSMEIKRNDLYSNGNDSFFQTDGCMEN